MNYERLGLDASAPLAVSFVDNRSVPVEGLTITATSSGGAQTLFTTEEQVVTHVDRMTVVNITGTAATLSLHMVPDGGTIGNGNKELDAFNVPANTTLPVQDLLGGAYPPGTTCEVYSGTNGSLVIRGTLRQER